MFKNNFVAVVKCNGKILREYSDNTVRLPYGSEYSIYLKNEEARPALVDITVDGEGVLKGHQLILNGNTSTEIKGFMRDMKETNRFKFIKKTKEISDYRGDRIEDGLVKITFQFEEEVVPITWTYSCSSLPTDEIYYRAPSFDNTCNSTYSISNCNNICNFCSTDNKLMDSVLDDGITVKGSKVNQVYNYGHIGTLESKKSVIIFRLKGKTRSVKKEIVTPVTVKTVIRCETCGRKNKSRNNFCYNCGTYLD